MSRLGSAKLAKQIADRTKPLPEGWSRLGGGAFREALLGPDGVCYKRLYVPGEVHNKREYENYRELRKSTPKGVRLPRMRYFPSCDVIAAKCVRGVTGDKIFDDPKAHQIFKEARKALNDAGFWDAHHFNLVVDGKDAYYIDLGEPRS